MVKNGKIFFVTVCDWQTKILFLIACVFSFGQVLGTLLFCLVRFQISVLSLFFSAAVLSA